MDAAHRPVWRAVAEAVSAGAAEAIDPGTVVAVAGGDINRGYRLGRGTACCFVKLNEASRHDMFQAEAEGLAALGGAPGGPRVPRVLAHGAAAGHAYLALEWLDLGPAGGTWPARMGEALARLHRVGADAHGWHRDNTIGTTSQPNARDTDWARFFARRRLGHQLDLLEAQGRRDDLVERGRRLQAAVPQLLSGHRPPPSLLHGDLWGGNAGALADGTPAVYDPAVYFGDRETDLAMTELFGGFGPEFRAAYEAAWPLPEGYPVRRDLYQLYHLLNHLNLFGGGYAGACRRVIDRLLAEVGGGV